jgi:hypothetical protein
MPVFHYVSGDNILITLMGFLVLWIVVSIPVYIASKVISKHSSFGRAMAATLLGPVVYFVVLTLAALAAGPVVGIFALPLALLLAFLSWLWIYKSLFQTGWLGAFGIALLAVVLYAALIAVLAFLMGFAALGGFHPRYCPAGQPTCI